MTRGIHIEVRDLPAPIQSALKSVGYGARDVECIPAESVSPLDAGSAGRRGFVALIDLASGKSQIFRGSWGGANMFNPTNAVDMDGEYRTLPVGGVAIKGSMGHPRTFATVYFHPDRPLLASGIPAKDLPEKAQEALYCHSSIKGGQYRRDELARKRVPQATIDALVELGLLVRNKAGAVSITTEGKNAQDGSVRF